MDWAGMISAELLFLVAFLLGVGVFLKLLPVFRADWAIPVILWGLGMVFSTWFMVMDAGWSGRTLLDGVVQGTFIAAAAVFSDQVVKQVTVKRREDKQTE